MKRIALLSVLALTGCTPAQQAQLVASQTKIEAAVADNAAKIQAVCSDVLTVANDPLTDLAAMTVPVVAQMQASSRGVCLTAEGIAAAAKSASSVDWLSSAATVMSSQGTVLPPVVKPIPVGGAS